MPPQLQQNQPIPLRLAPYTPPGASLGGGKKLAFFRGPHPAFEAQYDVVPDNDRLARYEQDNTLWAGAYSGFVQYPREISADNRDQPVWPAADSVTEYVWGMGNSGGVFGRQPLSSRVANANFFASDPMQFKSNGGGFVAGIHGGALAPNGTMTPSGAWGFLTPGTDSVKPVYRQTIMGGLFPTMSTKDLQASSVFNPLPAFGTVVPRLP